MAEVLRRRSALAGLVSRVRAANGDTRLVIAEQAPLTLVQVDAWPEGCEACLAAVEEVSGVRPDRTPCRAARGEDGTAALWIGPNRWLLSSRGREDLPDAIARAVPAGAGVVVDQSHGRVCLRLSGPALREVLSAGSSLDFDPARPHGAIGPDDCPGTAFGQFAVTVHFVEPDVADLYVFRSYAVSFVEVLQGIAAEHGYRYLGAPVG